MKIVINSCFGGFSLSPRAVQRLAELRGLPCYFFKGYPERTACSMEDISAQDMFWAAYSVPVIPGTPEMKEWFKLSEEERRTVNTKNRDVCLSRSSEERNDPLLIQVVEELGAAANGACAKLRVVEIPDGTEWEISDYDGAEKIEEKHQSWS